MLANSATSGCAAANATRTRLAVSATRAAVLENQHGACHLADLVASLNGWHFDAEVAGGEAVHDAGEVA